MGRTKDASLLLLLTSAIAACGSSNVVAPSLADGGSGEDGGAAADAANEGGGLRDAGQDGDAACPAGSSSDGDGGCLPPTVRRPFLVGASLRSAQAVARSDWTSDAPLSPVALPAPTARRLAESWLKDALEEHASVAAFARFTMHLLAHGAPPELVAGAQRASLDEIRHATLCFGLAQRYGGDVRGPGPLALDGAFAQHSLVEIAALAAEEGCVGETLGAALAREQLGIATDPGAIAALRRIARDEARHAELSWKFIRWAVLRGGDEIRRVVKERVAAAIARTLAMEIASYEGIDLDVWHGHGRLTCLESRAVAKLAIEEVVRPCLEAALAASDDELPGRAPSDIRETASA